MTGLVTKEDLLEGVFGDIRSSSDVRREELIKKQGDGRFSLAAVRDAMLLEIPATEASHHRRIAGGP